MPSEQPGNGPQTMRAIVQHRYGGPDTLSLTDQQPVPHPGPGEVRVRVHASSVAAGDVYLMNGRPYLIRLFGFGLLTPKNRVPGLDVAGVVDAVGNDVTRLKVGDAVFGELQHGTFADFVTGPEDRLAHMPAGISFDEAAAMPTSGMTALTAVREHGRVAPGERVLVIGATGGVGHFALQIAVAEGGEVDAVGSGKNADLARELGAARFLDRQRDDYTTVVSQYDVVIDTVGNIPYRTARQMLRPGGRWVIVSAGRGGDVLGPIPRLLWAAVGNTGRNAKLIGFVTMPASEKLDQLASLVGKGALRSVVQQTYDLTEVPRALADQAAGGARGKRVIRVRS